MVQEITRCRLISDIESEAVHGIHWVVSSKWASADKIVKNTTAAGSSVALHHTPQCLLVWGSFDMQNQKYESHRVVSRIRVVVNELML